MSKTIHIVHLYAKEMNIYGDTGNRLILEKRLRWRGIPVQVSTVNAGEPLPKDATIIIGGGGQDAGQQVIEDDLQTKAEQLHDMTEAGVVMLMVCGMYQLFCRRFVTQDGLDIKGLGIFAAETVAGNNRLIGNVVTESNFGRLIGYENHSGQTQLDERGTALGRVSKGAGNNGKDKTEGCVYKNVFGTYMHGPILSKNPAFADELIRRALEYAGMNPSLNPLDDNVELRAAEVAQKRPR